MRCGSSYTRIFDAAIPTSGRPSKAPAKADSQSGAASASLFNRAISSVLDASKPWLLAAQNPRFSRFRISLSRKAAVSENSRATISGEPSSEPLSTTITSNGGSQFWSASDSRQDLKRSQRFQDWEPPFEVIV